MLVLMLASTYVHAQLIEDNQKIAALVIGNSAYTGGNPYPPLNFPPVDIQNVVHCLSDQYKIYTRPLLQIRNAGDFRIELQSFKDYCGSHGITKVIIYYTGHGAVALGENFIIPTNFKINGPSDVYNGLNADVTDFLNKISSPSADTAINAFKETVNNYLVAKNAMSIHEICDYFKDYNVLLISDACRSKLSIVTKGASSSSVNTSAYLTQWSKANWGHMKRSRLSQFIVDFNALYQDMINQNGSAIDGYSRFSQTMSDKSVRQGVTLLFGTNFYNPAYENPETFSSIFTNAWLASMQSCYSPTITFNQNQLTAIIKKIPTNIQQHPVIDGIQNFVIENIPKRGTIINANIIRQVINNTADDRKNFFTATRIEDRSTGQAINLKTTYNLIANNIALSKLQSDDPFSSYFNHLNCASILINYWVSLPDIRIFFEGKHVKFYAKSSVMLPSKSNYELDTTSCTFKLKGNPNTQTDQNTPGTQSILNSHISDGSTIDFDNYQENDQEIVADSIIKLSQPLVIDKLDLTFNQLIIHKINSSLDTVEVALNDLRPWKSGKKFYLLIVRSADSMPFLKSKRFFSTDLPYMGGTLSDSLYVLNELSTSCNNERNNKPLNFQWTSGEYQMTINLKPEYSISNPDSSIAANTNILHMEVNDVTTCDNPLINCACGTGTKGKTINKVTFPKSLLRNSVSTYTFHFKVYSATPDRIRLSFPLYADYAGLSRIDIKNIEIRLLNQFDDATVNTELAAQAAIQRHIDSLAQIVAAQQQQQQLLVNRTHYACSEFTKSNLYNENFDYQARYYIVNNFDTYQYDGNGNMDVARDAIYYTNAYNANSADIDYEMETQMSFNDDHPYDANVDKSQYFVWDATIDNNNYIKGYYFSKYKENHSNYLEFGYREGNNFHAIQSFSCTSFSQMHKITVRKVGSVFYVFFDQNYKGNFQVNDYKPGRRCVIENQVARKTNADGNEYYRQLQFGGKVSVDYFRVDKLN